MPSVCLRLEYLLNSLKKILLSLRSILEKDISTKNFLFWKSEGLNEQEIRNKLENNSNAFMLFDH